MSEAFVAAGIYDPEAADAAERWEAIRLALDAGATPDEVIHAARTSNLGALIADLSLRPPPPMLTIEEVAARAGVDVELARRLWRAAGFPEAAPGVPSVYAAEANVYRLFGAASALFGVEPIVDLARVVGASTMRMAEAIGSSFRTNLGSRAIADPTGLALVRANAATSAMLEPFEEVVMVLLRRHLRGAIRPQDVEAPVGADTALVCVGFADLVEFTARSSFLEPAELSGFLARFERAVADAVVDGGGRLVKLIGDEAMFVAPEIDQACRIAVRLAGLSGREGLPPLRVGVAGDACCHGKAIGSAER